VLVEQKSLLKSFVRIVFYTSAVIRNAFSFHKLPNIHFCQHFLQISHSLITINDQINISGEKTKEVRHSRKTVSNNEKQTCIGQLTTLLKLERTAGAETEQMNYENSLQQI